jgi:hypothetical protein
MFPTTATIRAAKLDHVAGGQQQLPTGKVMSDCHSMDIRNTQYQSVYLNFSQQFQKGEDRIKRVAR